MESKQGIVYGTSHRQAKIWAFNVRTEKLTWLGEGAVGSQGYVASIHVDPTGRYLYYVPGAHGGATKDKVIAFLHAYFQRTCGQHSATPWPITTNCGRFSLNVPSP